MRAKKYLHLCMGVFFLFSLDCSAAERGDIAPDFTLPSLLQNSPVALSDYRGRIVLLDFWSTWCLPCRESLPELSKLRNEFSQESFELISIDIDARPDDAKKFLMTVNFTHPMVMDPQAASAALYGLTILPTAFLINRDGVIEKVHQNLKLGDLDQLKKEISMLIADR